jgi:hypothetical protein
VSERQSIYIKRAVVRAIHLGIPKPERERIVDSIFPVPVDPFRNRRACDSMSPL